jgi:hypothetical protein
MSVVILMKPYPAHLFKLFVPYLALGDKHPSFLSVNPNLSIEVPPETAFRHSKSECPRH